MFSKNIFLLSLLYFIHHQTEVSANADPSPILGGNDVFTNSELSYTVGIIDKAEPKKLCCTGAIISMGAVLTAAECLPNGWLSPEQYIIKYGTWERVSLDPSDLKIVSSIIYHPEYRNEGKQFQHNLAIIKVSSRFDENLRSRTINIPLLPVRGDALPTTGGIITGWGYVNWSNKKPYNLYAALNIPILSAADCIQYYPSDKNLITSQTCCAGSSDQHGCLGDLGGPLVARDGSELTIIGVQVCSENCKESTGKPAVYALLDDSIDWVRENSAVRTL